MASNVVPGVHSGYFLIHPSLKCDQKQSIGNQAFSIRTVLTFSYLLHTINGFVNPGALI